MTSNFTRAATAAAAACCVLSAFAADLPREGRYDFTSCYSGVSTPIQFSKTHSANTYEQTGTSRSASPGGLFDKSTFRCLGIGQSFDGKTAGTTVCEGVDSDGDKYLSHFVIEGSNAHRTVVAGTGKYEGIVVSGTTEPLGPFPAVKPGTYQNCVRQIGTYKMK